jgi:iron-sulfur cluster repair protein YtfE (RIC family)
VHDPFALLTADHREVEQLLEKLGKAEDSERPALVAQLDSALRLHMSIEEQLLYPIVNKHLGEDESEEAAVEHKLAREGLDKLRELMEKPGFGAAVEMLKGDIEHHVHDEENEMFPQLAARFDEKQRAALGHSIADAKASAAVSNGDTRNELLEAARRHDIEGRLTMTKDELREALSAN